MSTPEQEKQQKQRVEANLASRRPWAQWAAEEKTFVKAGGKRKAMSVLQNRLSPPFPVMTDDEKKGVSIFIGTFGDSGPLPIGAMDIACEPTSDLSDYHGMYDSAPGRLPSVVDTMVRWAQECKVSSFGSTVVLTDKQKVGVAKFVKGILAKMKWFESKENPLRDHFDHRFNDDDHIDGMVSRASELGVDVYADDTVDADADADADAVETHKEQPRQKPTEKRKTKKRKVGA